MSPIGPKSTPLRLDPGRTRVCGSRCCVATAGDAKGAARCRTWKFITNSFAATLATIQKRT